jgi:hypothetical protein
LFQDPVEEGSMRSFGQNLVASAAWRAYESVGDESVGDKSVGDNKSVGDKSVGDEIASRSASLFIV